MFAEIKSFLTITVLVLGMTCTSGCLYMMYPSSTRSIGGNELEQPFHELQNSCVVLKRPLRVLSFWGEKIDQPDSVRFYVDGGISLEKHEQSPKELLAGTPICFDYLSFNVTKDYCFFFILTKICYKARFYIEGHSPDERYTYIWGRGLYIHRAPWEDEDTPKRRYVGFNGRSYKPDNKKEGMATEK